MRRGWLRAVLPLTLAMAIAACGGTPGEDTSNTDTGTESDTAAVKTDGFEDLGDVTLKVVSSEGSGGPRDAIRELTKQFEAKYPNVTVDVQFRDFASASLYDALDAAGHGPVRADYDLEARAAAPHEAELLGLAPDAPVLFATTVALGEDGRVVDLGRTVYRADRYRFQATLMRRAHRDGGRQ